jgi:NAD(P)-dependent dehydrogenase (short-subunit alcohol dehydrogenase family)
VNRLQDKVALITGGAGGMGSATAKAMASEGARVVVSDINDDAGQQVCDEIGKAGGGARYLHLDVRREAEWIGVLEEIESRLGGLDILANIAAVCALTPISQTSYESWRWQLDVDLDGKFFGCKHGLRLLAKSGRGSIVNISSSVVYEGSAGAIAYSAAKGGVLAFSKAVAAECARANNGVRVNCIIPGPVETMMWVKMNHGGVLPSPDDLDYDSLLTRYRDGAAASSQVKRAGRPEDIAAAVVYLASDEAGYVHGIDLIVDGGRAIAAR